METMNLTKVYGSGRKAITAVDQVNLKIPKGSIFGLLGPNGAGKTTLIMMLMGLLLPTKGGARVLGYDIIKESIQIRRRVGFLPEGVGFYESLSARANLRYVAALNQIPTEKQDEIIDKTLRIVGLHDRAEDKVSSYSRGMKQRLALAQALIKDPEFLILDEPTAGVDPRGTVAFKNLIKKLAGEGKTILVSTHLLHEIGPICTHIAIMNKGEVLVQGPITKISEMLRLEQGLILEVTIDGDAKKLASHIMDMKAVSGVDVWRNKLTIKCNRDISPEIAQKAVELNLKIKSITSRQPSLEEIFLKYIPLEEAW